MKETKIKICGITNLEDAKHAASLGVDALGFNFYKQSPRYIDPEKAGLIIEALEFSGLLVGVFVDSSEAQIDEIVSLSGINAVQYHGDAIGKSREVTTIKAIRLQEGLNRKLIPALLEVHDYLLIDAFSRNAYGGTGKQIGDDLISDSVTKTMWERVYLAGGLTPENIADKVEKYDPYAVDVASGVEESPGVKDRAKVEMFVMAVKRVSGLH